MEKVISIIDDDVELVALLREFLVSEGYTVHTHQHTTFIDVLEKDNYDLLLLDVWFNTNKAGIEMAQAIGNRKNLGEKPIILISSDSDLPRHASVAKISNFLSKPLDVRALLETINNLLQPARPLCPEFAACTQSRE